MERVKEKARKNTFIHLSNSYSVINVGWVLQNNGNPQEGMMSIVERNIYVLSGRLL